MESLGKLSFGSTGWGDELLIGAVMTVGLALASVLIGLVIGVDGVAALLGMLTSCASGISVVNIDNGFGAGFLANRINRLE